MNKKSDDLPEQLPIRVVGAKISRKIFHKAAFPVYSKRIISRQHPENKIITAEIEKKMQPAIQKKRVAAGYCTIKNLKEIIQQFSANTEKFADYLNEFIGEMTEIVLLAGGGMERFSENGFLFYFSGGLKEVPKLMSDCLNTALKMRYRVNKLNRRWEFFREDSWKIGIGINYGEGFFQDDDSREARLIGPVAELTRNIGKSSLAHQIIIPEQSLKYGVDITAYKLSKPRHVPVKGLSKLLKVVEIIDLYRE